MRINTTQRGLLVTTFTCVLFAQSFSPVLAETINLANSGNGQSSSSNGSYNLQNTQNVAQTNAVDVNNSLNISANTGNNTAKDNFGGVLLSTGDINSSTNVSTVAGSNTALLSGNASVDVDLQNAGNGQSSSNDINFSYDLTLLSNQGNTISVSNLSDKTLNTGGNTAKDNHGDVSIDTGAIAESTKLTTSAGLNSFYKDPNGALTVVALNEGNGRDSSNNITISWSEIFTQNQFNAIAISNTDNKNLTSGDNTCKDNQGSCSIKTGDIASLTEIANEAGQNQNPPMGGPLPTQAPTVTPSPSVTLTPTPTEDEAAIQAETATNQKDDGFIKDVKSAAEKAAEIGKILGAVRLPNTGIGGSMALLSDQLLIGLSFVTAGLIIKRKSAEYSLAQKRILESTN